MISGQSLTCPKGASLTFEIDMDTGSDLTGATAQWALCESWFDQAKVYLTKTGAGDGLFIGQDGGVWKITVNIAPADTLDIPSGLLYHDCKVLLQSGDVEDVANGPFSLDPSVNILNTNAPITRNLRVNQSLGRPGQVATLTVGTLPRNLLTVQSLGTLRQTATAAPAVIWNSSDKDPAITLSDNDLTGTMNTAVFNRLVRATTSKATGYFEVVFSSLGTAEAGVGFTNTSALSSSWAGVDVNGIGYYRIGGGSVYMNSTLVAGSIGTFAVGDVLGLELAASSMKFYKNGTLVYRYTGARPVGSLFPTLSLGYQDDSGTADFGATVMSYLPSGVTSWDGKQTNFVPPTETGSLGPIDVMVVAGQSNATGFQDDPGSLSYTADASVIVYDSNEALVSYAPNTGFAGLETGGTSVRWAGEMEYSRQYRTANPSKKLAILKVTAPGTDLAVNWNVQTQGGLYYQAAAYIQAALYALISAGYSPTVQLVYWMQGENDAGNSTYAAAYEANLTNLINGIRTDWNVGSTKIVIGRIRTAAGASSAAVRTAEHNVADANPGGPVWIIDTDDLTVNTDNLHYTSASQITIGQRIWAVDQGTYTEL